MEVLAPGKKTVYCLKETNAPGELEIGAGTTVAGKTIIG
jgi:hypothetical protein